MSTLIGNPYSLIQDRSGLPLDAGYVYIGQENLDPEAFPLPVYFDADLTIPASQPLRTINGYFSNNGSPAKIFIAPTFCSISIKDKNQSVVFVDLKYGSESTYIISTISDLSSLPTSDGAIVYVQDQDCFFTYDAATIPLHDGGLFINGWKRRFKGLFVQPEWWGAKVNDDSPAQLTINDAALKSATRVGIVCELSEGYYYTDKPLVLLPTTKMRGQGAISHYNSNAETLGSAIIKLTDSVDSTLPTSVPGGISGSTVNLSTKNAVVIAHDLNNKQNGYAGSLDIEGITFARFQETFPVGHTNNDNRWYKFDGTRYCPRFQEGGPNQGGYVAPNTYTLLATGLSQSSFRRCNFYGSRYNVFVYDSWLVTWDRVETFLGTGFKIVTGTNNVFSDCWALAPSWNVPTDTGDIDQGKCYGYSIGGSNHSFPAIACDGIGRNTLPAQAVFHSINPLNFNISSIATEGCNAYAYLDIVGWGSGVSTSGTSSISIGTLNCQGFNNSYYNAAIPEAENAIFKTTNFCNLSINTGFIELTSTSTVRASKQHFCYVGWGSSTVLGAFWVKGATQQVTGYVIGSTPYPDDTRTIGHNEVWLNYEKFNPSSFRWNRGSQIINISDNYLNNGLAYFNGDITVTGIEPAKALNFNLNNRATGAQSNVSCSNGDGRFLAQSVRGGQYYGLMSTNSWIAGYDSVNLTAFTDNNWSPISDNTKSLGLSNRRWTTVYAATGAINTSDERVKQQFRSIEESERAAALEIKSNICFFKFNDAVDLKGDGARWHVGVKAQQVIEIMTKHDLNWEEYGFICYDEWPEVEEVIGEDGNILQHHQEAGSRYAIRYDELIMFILSAT